jgi:hypothetical protein
LTWSCLTMFNGLPDGGTVSSTKGTLTSEQALTWLQSNCGLLQQYNWTYS